MGNCCVRASLSFLGRDRQLSSLNFNRFFFHWVLHFYLNIFSIHFGKIQVFEHKQGWKSKPANHSLKYARVFDLIERFEVCELDKLPESWTLMELVEIVNALLRWMVRFLQFKGTMPAYCISQQNSFSLMDLWKLFDKCLLSGVKTWGLKRWPEVDLKWVNNSHFCAHIFLDGSLMWRHAMCEWSMHEHSTRQPIEKQLTHLNNKLSFFESVMAISTRKKNRDENFHRIPQLETRFRCFHFLLFLREFCIFLHEL